MRVTETAKEHIAVLDQVRCSIVVLWNDDPVGTTILSPQSSGLWIELVSPLGWERDHHMPED